jgi:streptogramin lyase/mono/diheme cytochrome c family protein
MHFLKVVVTAPGMMLVAAALGVLGALTTAGALRALGAPAAQSASIAAEEHTTKDEHQRSAEIYGMKTTAASGSQRGEEIYYYKCWFCHNQYAKTGPPLKDLYKRPTLMVGGPVNDQTVADKIRGGGPAMPAYRHTLKEADIADLIGYFRSGKCCFEGDEPPPNPRYRGASVAQPVSAATRSRRSVLGGARGTVRTVKGDPLEGIMVQLVSLKTAIRTTVYSNEEGRYEFPLLETGLYTLRIARPLEFKPYVKESIRIEGATQLEAIVLRRVSETEVLPPTPDILAQLTGAEWMLNLPSNGEEKRTFSLTCGFGCHSYQQIFRTRYDENGWRLIVQRMLRGAGSPLINVRSVTSQTRGRAGRPIPEEEEIVIKWLARVRGPEAKDPPLHHFPLPRGASTRAVVTEYELPRGLLAPHDVHGDSKGNIWYTPHRSPYIGKLDPRTGAIKEYRVPDTPGALPGTHRVWVDKADIVWVSENWSHNLTRFDPRTEQFKQFAFETDDPLNSPGFSNFHMDSEGFVYETALRHVVRMDSRSGKVVQKFPFTRINSTYDNIVSFDDRYWSGGQTGTNLLGLLDRKTGQLWELETRTPVSSPARGGFDLQGNAWFGGRGGMLIRLDPKTQRITEYYPPIPFVTFYEAMPDKNGEVWAGALHAGRILRFNPRTERWIEYLMPEPYSHNRRTWIDNSTAPVTIWYVDHNGYLVRIQPLE